MKWTKQAIGYLYANYVSGQFTCKNAEYEWTCKNYGKGLAPASECGFNLYRCEQFIGKFKRLKDAKAYAETLV